MRNAIYRTYHEIEVSQKLIWEWILILVICLMILWLSVFAFSLSFKIALLSSLGMGVIYFKIYSELKYRIDKERKFLKQLENSKEYFDPALTFEKGSLLLKNIITLQQSIEYSSLRYNFVNDYEFRNIKKELEYLIELIIEKQKSGQKFEMYKHYFHEALTKIIKEIYLLEIKSKDIDEW